MLFRLKTTLERQMVLLAACALVAFLMSFIVDYSPRLRLSPELLLKGSIGGVLICGVSALLTLSAVFVFPDRFRREYDLERSALVNLNGFGILGAAITAGAGEELLFRGFLFTALSKLSGPFAYITHYIFVTACYVHRRALYLTPCIRGIECSLYAAMFSYNRSLAMLAVAHGIVQAATFISYKLGWIDHVFDFRKRFLATSILRREAR
ncbi:MAG: CPBP family intramembrane metalloprotease [Bdellovibrionales bacterium]|nr:CPBP family intramembrane metalloprotease [Bdellovibrionales bacterium]